MPFQYESGTEIQKGDHIRYDRGPGVVEFIVDSPTGEAAMDWYLEENPGGGIMISTTGYGNVFLPDPQTEEDLEFVSRREPGTPQAAK
jgi:hypothetical protein